MTCAKALVLATITTPDGRTFVGTNYARRPQAACPRLPGEDYTKCKTVCDQPGHAEINALKLAGEHARGATLTITGHTYAPPCTEAARAAGVIKIAVE